MSITLAYLNAHFNITALLVEKTLCHWQTCYCYMSHGAYFSTFQVWLYKWPERREKWSVLRDWPCIDVSLCSEQAAQRYAGLWPSYCVMLWRVKFPSIHSDIWDMFGTSICVKQFLILCKLYRCAEVCDCIAIAMKLACEWNLLLNAVLKNIVCGFY